MTTHGVWWRDYFGNNERSTRRKHFARSHV